MGTNIASNSYLDFRLCEELDEDSVVDGLLLLSFGIVCLLKFTRISSILLLSLVKILTIFFMLATSDSILSNLLLLRWWWSSIVLSSRLISSLIPQISSLILLTVTDLFSFLNGSLIIVPATEWSPTDFWNRYVF